MWAARDGVARTGSSPALAPPALELELKLPTVSRLHPHISLAGSNLQNATVHAPESSDLHLRPLDIRGCGPLEPLDRP